jgi:hypothetical protein
MPNSYIVYKPHIKQFFQNKIHKNSKILDVGPGVGTYSKLLKEIGYDMDCIEIFKPYIEKYNLSEKYNTVYEGNIIGFDISKYHLIILGDVLEHVDTNEAQSLIKEITEKNKKCLVAVPYLMEQGEHEGNIHETHLQPDLTPKIMKQRYPELSLLVGNRFYGYYINDDIQDHITNEHHTTYATKYFDSLGLANPIY